MNKPKFNADDAEQYIVDLCQYYKSTKEQIFKRDNEGNDSFNMVYSAEYQKWLGMEIAAREVLEYFSKFDLKEGEDE